MALDFTKAVDRVRLAVGDTLELPIFPDALYQQVLDKNDQDENATSLEMAKYILGYISQNGFREQAGTYQIYGREWLQSYLDFLKTFLLSSGTAAALNAKIYAGGISISDMQQNDLNPDNNIVPTTDFDDIHQSSGLPVAAVAAMNNEGRPENNTPARPFVTESLVMSFENKAAMRPVRSLLDIKIPLKLTLSRIGGQAVELFKWNIYNGAWVDNAPYTISLKGVNSPLVDTGEMADLTRYRITMNVPFA